MLNPIEPPKSPIVAPEDLINFDIEAFINEHVDPAGTTSLVMALNAMESSILSPAGEGSSRRRLESTFSSIESPLDPNTRAKIGELLEPTLEKSVIFSQKSAIPEVAVEVPTKAIESHVEVGEVREPVLGESTISFGKSPISEVAMDVPTTLT